MGKLRTLSELIKEFGQPIASTSEHVKFASPIKNQVIIIPKDRIAGGFGEVITTSIENPKLEEELAKLAEKENPEMYKRIKKTALGGGLAAADSQLDAQTQMNPLEPLKEIGYAVKPAYDKYKQLKDKFFEAGAKQLDFTGQTPEIVKPIATAGSIVGDPMNYIPGGAGISLNTAATGLDFLPEKQTPEVDNKEKYKKLRTTMGLP